MNKSCPTLYILMRTDMDSMNPGKAVAQGTHAANKFESDMENIENDSLLRLFDMWKRQTTQGFGTCIVLDCPTFETLFNKVELFKYHQAHKKSFLCGSVTDPTYPVSDGKITHLISIDTCAYVFLDRDSIYKNFLSDLELMK